MIYLSTLTNPHPQRRNGSSSVAGTRMRGGKNCRKKSRLGLGGDGRGGRRASSPHRIATMRWGEVRPHDAIDDRVISAMPVHLTYHVRLVAIAAAAVISILSPQKVQARGPKFFHPAAWWRSSETGPTTRQLASSPRDGGGAAGCGACLAWAGAWRSGLHLLRPGVLHVLPEFIEEKIEGDGHRSYK
jgi:hypothetical protein